MQYVITFLEGFLSFLSPCLLPLLPVYISYFMAGETANRKSKTVINAMAFVFGFSLVFSLLGLFAGTISTLLKQHQRIVNLISGALIVMFGLSYLGIIRISGNGKERKIQVKDAFSAFLFGVVYSVSLTPCVGAFLGSALAMASASGTALKGLTLLLAYCFGLGIPFILSALLIERMKDLLKAIKSHYDLIEKLSGIFLIVTGVLMATGLLGKLTSLLSF